MEYYEKKYKESLERMKSWVRGEHPECFTEAQKAAEFIFPELAESEDERIRKALINVFTIHKDYEVFFGVSVKDIRTWIEKQGEQSKEVTYTHEVETGNGNIKALVTEKVQLPKFKVGDWITNSIETVQITGYDIDYGYQVDCKGNLQHRDTDIIEKEYHLWSIQDAKDGDVLYSLDTNQPFIYKARNIHEQATAYCGINKYGKFFVWNTNDCIITLDKYIPATKEQRELLFRKMKEAGYVWNPTTKELSHKEVTKKSDKDGKKWIDEKVY